MRAVLYVVTGRGTAAEAAEKIGPEIDHRTVTRYVKRFVARAGDWLTIMAGYLTDALGGHYQQAITEIYAGIETTWNQITVVLEDIAERMDALPGMHRPGEPHGFLLAVVGMNAKALGP